MTTAQLNRIYLSILKASAECYEEKREASYGFFKWDSWIPTKQPVV